MSIQDELQRLHRRVAAYVTRVEAKLDAVRDLHKPVDTGAYRLQPGGERLPVIECRACIAGEAQGEVWQYDWPCDTARLVYSEAEIAAITQVPR